MSDSKNLSDYTKPRTDLNKLLPGYNLLDAKILEGFNHNLFNRFLTKDEVRRIVGIIGSDEGSTDDISSIIEPDPYRQANQLQPIIYNKVGNVDWFMSFRDFMNRLSLLGVNIDRFNEWGNSLQFNWIPPIDLDKLINYQDYYWDSTEVDDPPQYITIKNQCNWVDGRLTQQMRSVTNALNSYVIVASSDILNSIDVQGEQTSNIRVGECLVLTGSENALPAIAPVTSTVYTPGSDSTTVFLDFNLVAGSNDDYTTAANTELPVVAVEDEGRRVIVSGDVTDLFVHGYVFDAEDSATLDPYSFFKVESSEYNVVADITVITLTDDIIGFDYSRITTKPLLHSMIAEYNEVCLAPFSREAYAVFTTDVVGDIIWSKRLRLRQATTGVGEGTELGSNLFTDSAGSKDFLDGSYQVGDVVFISGTGFDGEYPIENIVTSDVLAFEGTFFEQDQINYQILRDRLLTDIESDVEPTATDIHEYWFDTVNDQLRQWDGAFWQVRVRNYSYLVDVAAGAHLIDQRQFDDWSEQNKWKHGGEIRNFTGLSRAQLPIIEYFPLLELSEYSFADKKWRYRRNDDVSYTSTTAEPTLFELIDTRITAPGSGEVSFQNATTILFDEKFGNLTADLTEGTDIQFLSFGANSGLNTIVSSEYIQMAPGERFRTRAVLANPVSNPLDVPNGAHIAPATTSQGDPWISFETYHWQFEGIEDIAASSIVPTRNPMLDIVVGTSTNGPLTSILGMYFQEFKNVAGTPDEVGPTYVLDNSLHNLCLFEDYQEGDIRVYINGERQYGNFIDQRSGINNDYTGSIQFSTEVTITDNDVVRIELGEYALEDIGKRAVTVNTVSGPELFNLVDIRRIEQEKTERSQYPLFSIYDVNKNGLRFASNLFRYKDDSAGTYFLDIDQRITFDENTLDYTFEQGLVDETTGEIYLYFDKRESGDEFQSIWKRGNNDEQYVPIERDGFWEIPNQLYYNVGHENRQTIRLTEVFRHFNSIIEAQTAQGIGINRFSNVFRLDADPNYGLAGSIKEHNDGLDTLISAMFVNNVNPVDLIEFANDRYDNHFTSLREFMTENIVDYALTTGPENVEEFTALVVEEVKDEFERNDRLDQWFGDSTTFNEATNQGIKNWIATIPYFNLGPKFQPYILEDLDSDFLQLVHHDGHRSDMLLSPATVASVLKVLEQNTATELQTVTSDAEPFPTTVNGNPAANGNFLIRTNTTTRTRVLYRYNTLNEWEELDISLLFANVALSAEQDLFDLLPDSSLPDNFVSNFDFSVTQGDVEYEDKIREQFSKFVTAQRIASPFTNAGYVQNDPFTWNYAYTSIKTDPLTGNLNTNVFGSWQALYDNIYRTPYPHLEPWRLQGYDSKPVWWDSEYLDPTETRRWISTMWANILTGVVPVTGETPEGVAGTGVANQITELYTYIPVNMDGTATTDGYEPDAILPPYWNSNNSPNPAVRSLHDSSLQEFIITPSAIFEFGQLGPQEWLWSVSSQRLYDELVAAFKLQPMKFMNQTMGSELIDVSCLQVDDRRNQVASHSIIQFHGDIDTNNAVIQVDGLNQWYVHYNRYNGFDGVSSEFRDLWQGWTAPLTYQFASFIDTANFKISSDLFDVANRDYSIIFKKTTGIRDVWLDALEASVTAVPSRFADTYDAGEGWTISLTNNSPVGRPIQAYGIQNYPIYIETGSPTIRTFSFPMADAEIQDSFGFDVVQYSETVAPETPTELNNDPTQYFASVEVNNATTINLVIDGDKAQTFGTLVDELNLQLGTDATAYLQDGNLYIRSDTIGGLTFCTITDAGLFSSASATFLGTSGNIFNLLAFDKIFYVNGDVGQYFPDGEQFDIIGSTNFDGTYTTVETFYDVNTRQTRIEVEEQVSIPTADIDGNLEPANAVALPDEWVDGVGLSWSTNDTTPIGVNDTDLYFLVRDNDREFRLARTREAAINDTSTIAFNGGTGQGQQFVGRLKNTFTAFNARSVLAYWKQHYVDSRITYSYNTPVTVTGVQNMIDLLNGYDGFLRDQGFVYQDTDGVNRDPSTGREYDWQFETERLIEFLYNTRSLQQQIVEEYDVVPDFNTDTFTAVDAVQWNTGTRVTIISDGGELPAEFDNPLSGSIPYYVIQTATPGVLQLAATANQARNGVALPFTDNGTGTIQIRLAPEIDRNPSILLDPHQRSILIDHDTGVLASVFDGGDLDVITNQRVYDAEGLNLSTEDLIVSRKDKRTQIELSNGRVIANNANEATARIIGGMHLFFDGYEHVLQFPNYSSSNFLIYDPFLGINIPRFALEFDRQDSFTLRPNVGGSVVLDQTQVQNFESAVESLRYAYSPYRSKEGDEITRKVREGLGYNGPYDYADDINITDKSQFIFYRGLIQKKGTNFAANAFANQLEYEELEIDEFWAYHRGCFGDSKEKIYPEMKLFNSDVQRRELRLEFIPQLGTLSDASFIPIELTDEDRWFNQPDQLELLEPRDRFYTNTAVTERYEDVVNNPRATVTPADPMPAGYFVENGFEYLQLEKAADGAFINYLVPASNPEQYIQLTEGVDYQFVTTKLIKFINFAIVPSNRTINVSALSYSYDAQNPARVINRRDGVVTTEVPMWNPARQQYYSRAIYPVRFHRDVDPARYSDPQDGYPETEQGDDNFWDSRYSDHIWFDSLFEDYLPYDDRSVTGNIDTRLKNWGKLSDFGEIKVFQWTESDVPPSEYNALSATADADGIVPIDDRKTGKVREVLFRNDLSDFAGGSGYAVSDTITLTDGTTLVVTAEAAGVVTEFTVDGEFPQPFDGSALFQSTSSGTGSGFFVTPIWVEERTEAFDFIAETVGATTFSDVGAPLNTEMRIYIDGQRQTVSNATTGESIDFTLSFSSDANFKLYADYVSGAITTPTPLPVPPQGTFIKCVVEETVPTTEQLNNFEYKFDTPFSAVRSTDRITGDTVFTYYFWVEDRLSSIPVLGGGEGNTTLLTVKEGLQAIPTAYMVPNNMIDLGSTTYSDLFKTTFPKREDTVSYELPFNYNQLIIKGLDTSVPADDAYTLRFTRDFSLRDRLADNEADISLLQRKNVHNEWTLIREKQFSKIDRDLWDSITESLLGFEYDGSPLPDLDVTPTPSPSPTPTVTVSPSVGASPTPTPSVTATATPTPTPAVTDTPAVTPTPSTTADVTPTPTPTQGSTPTPTPTQQATPPVTPTATVTPSVTPANSPPAPTPSITPSSSFVPNPSSTPQPTPTVTPNPTSTPTVTPPNTPPASQNPTVTPTVTPTNTPVVTPTPSPAAITLTDPQTVDAFLFDSSADTSDVAVDLRFRADGVLDFQRFAQGGGYMQIGDDYISGNPSSGIGANYDIRMNYSVLDVPASQILFTGPAENVWHNLGTNRNWEWRSDPALFATATVPVTIEIRPAGGGATIASRTYNISLIRIILGPIIP